jgi:hypothetical protein
VEGVGKNQGEIPRCARNDSVVSWFPGFPILLIPIAGVTIEECNMTSLLQQAIAEVEKLPAEGQDAIATRILAELADERAWAARFNATTDEQWERLAQGVRREIAAGDTTPRHDVLPPRVSQP